MKRIFFIDDDIDDRDIFKIALNALSIKTEYVEAKDGQEALEMLKQSDFTPPDIIFVDLNMPRLNGLEFIVKMKQIARYEDVPTYVYTTSTSPLQRVNCLTAGASGYIIKHANYKDLSKDLEALISKMNVTV